METGAWVAHGPAQGRTVAERRPRAAGLAGLQRAEAERNDLREVALGELLVVLLRPLAPRPPGAQVVQVLT